MLIFATFTGIRILPTAAQKDGESVAISLAGAATAPGKPSSFPEAQVRDAQKILIATIPDPKLTRMALHFDRWMESLHRAAEASKYTFERNWMPWASAQPDYERPGVLIFRGENEQRLAILLVGESPVSGINQRQFQFALTLARPTVLAGIAGPCFSGSFESLKQLLAGRDELKTGSPLRIRSGSATAKTYIDDFAKKYSFESTVDPDENAILALNRYLEYRRVKIGQRAVLEEGGTAYGSSGKTGKTGKEDHKDPTIHVTFPRDISVLRAAYESDQRLRRSLMQSAEPGETSDPSLSLGHEDISPGRDSVPMQSPIATAATQELVMQAVGRRLRETGVNLGTIYATNALDIVFLRQYMDAGVPDMQFYVLEPDILFTHRPEAAAFHGTLAVSRYPLFIRDNRNIVAFPSKSAEGVYWAARALLTPDQANANNPIWLTMIGIGGYWPIAPLCADAGSKCVFDNRESGLEMRPTKTYLGIWIAAIAGLLFVLCAVAEAQNARLKSVAPRKWCCNFYFDPAAPLVYARRYHAYCFVAGLIALLLLLSRPLAEVLGSYIYMLSGTISGFALLGLAGCWPMVRMNCPPPCLLWFDEGTSRADRRYSAVLCVIVTIGSAVMLGLLYGRVWGDATWSTFAAYRSMYLGNGVNPTLPLLLAALAILCCSWFHFQRFIYASERFVPLDLSEIGCLGGPYERLRNVLSRYATVPAILTAVVTSAFVGFLAWRYQSALSVEGADYDLFLVMVLAVAGGLTMLSVVQFLQAWWHLSDFLRELQTLPIRRVFERFPRDLGSVALFSSASSGRSHLYLVKARDCLRQIHGVPDDIRLDVENSVNATLVRDGADEHETGAEVVAVQSAMLRASSFLLTHLLHEVWLRGGSELNPPKEQEPQVALAEEFLAFRFLGFIRYAVLQLRNLLTYFSVAFVLLSMSVSCYPFFSQSLSQMYVGVAFAALSGSTGYVLSAMARDRTLRSLASDSKGKDHPVFVQAVQSAALPLIAFAGTYFPQLGRVLFTWLQPVLSSIK